MSSGKHPSSEGLGSTAGAAPRQTAAVPMSPGAQPEGAACPGSRALPPLLGHQARLPPSLCPLSTCCFQPGPRASPGALSLGQAALRHSWDVLTPKGSSVFPGIWLREGETLFGARRGLWAGQLCPSQQGRAAGAWQRPTEATCPAQQHQPGPARPWGQLQTAGGGTRGSTAWPPALHLPTAKARSRIHCCSQGWELPAVLGHLPPPHSKVCLARSLTL